jgi:hypothetical protein
MTEEKWTIGRSSTSITPALLHQIRPKKDGDHHSWLTKCGRKLVHPFHENNLHLAEAIKPKDRGGVGWKICSRCGPLSEFQEIRERVDKERTAQREAREEAHARAKRVSHQKKNYWFKELQPELFDHLRSFPCDEVKIKTDKFGHKHKVSIAVDNFVYEFEITNPDMSIPVWSSGGGTPGTSQVTHLYNAGNRQPEE